ncbi:hypothetical protein HMPREF0262_02933, partial [Clostridium sp. ATCC 29733]
MRVHRSSGGPRPQGEKKGIRPNRAECLFLRRFSNLPCAVEKGAAVFPDPCSAETKNRRAPQRERPP